MTTATRASFLIQATALLTPLLASFTGEKPSRNVWMGCLVALAGCLFIAADSVATDSPGGDGWAPFSFGEQGCIGGELRCFRSRLDGLAGSSQRHRCALLILAVLRLLPTLFATFLPCLACVTHHPGGDAAILSAAFFYSLATVRLGTYARYIPAVELAAGKSLVLGSAAIGLAVVAAAGLASQGEPLSELWPGYDSSPAAWGILVFSALGPGALAAFLHAKGQAVVPPAEAQVIFSTVPLWSVAFAFLLLGGEPMSEKTWVGGAALVAAGLIASGGKGAKADKQA